jgi:putative CocE/NonD family hydrolase
MGRGAKLLCVLGSVVAACLVTMPAHAQTVAGATIERGYITMRDGTKLHVHVELPETGRRLPAMLNYTYYGPGFPDGGTGDSSVLSRADLLERGYILVGVTVRGVGCSEGTFDLFDPQWSQDGYDVVEWIARQPWSNGKVGMYGTSGPGILQWMAAGARPPHLTAITPFSTLGDVVRDVGAPGGVKNILFAAFFQAAQNAEAGLNQPANPGDPECAVNGADNLSESPTHSGTYTLLTNEFETDEIALHHVRRYFEDVNVPTLTFHQWQDEQLPARVVRELGSLPRATTWMVAGNGNHSFPACAACQKLAYAFLDRYMKGIDNAWEHTPHYQLWEENTATGPNWAIGFGAWPPRVNPIELYLREGSRLSFNAPTGDEDPESYAYPRPASSRDGAASGGKASWQAGAPPGGALSWTSSPFERDRVLYSGSLDVWLASTATDTDMQATLTEIRPDGQEVYIQRGWLKGLAASSLDPARSTPTQPEYTLRAKDARRLKPGKPQLMRIGFFDFSKPIRKGSRVRVYLEAPVGLTGLWEFLFNQTEATNTAFHDSGHPSRLVLGVLPGEAARKPLPECDTQVSMPCRAVSGTLPKAEPEPAQADSARPPSTPCKRRTSVTFRIRDARPVVRASVGGRRARAHVRGRGRTARVVVTLRRTAARRVLVRFTVRLASGRKRVVARRVSTCVRPHRRG